MLARFAAFPPGHLTVGAHQTDASPHQMCNPKISQGSIFSSNSILPTQHQNNWLTKEYDFGLKASTSW